MTSAQCHYFGMTVNAQNAQMRLTEQVAEEIRALLARRRISGRELARRMNASPSWVNFRLTGAQEIGLNDLQRIAGALGVEAIELFPRTRPDDEVRRQPILQSFNLAKRTRPTSHPKQTKPRTNTRRPGQVSMAGHANSDSTADLAIRRTGRVVAVTSAYPDRMDDTEAWPVQSGSVDEQ